MCAIGLGLALLAPHSDPATAHPHTWIDVSIDVLFDESGNVTGLREYWLFDVLYTAYVVKVLGGGPGDKPLQEHIDGVLRENMKNLREQSYFTRVEQDGNEVAFSDVTEMSSSLQGRRLAMEFVLPFAAPVDPSDGAFTYAVFDPTYYIEMLHSDTGEAIRLEGAPAGCTYALAEPNPTAEAVALAASLDRTESAGDGLGILFAEHVEVGCR